jgi:hypothetical protein
MVRNDAMASHIRDLAEKDEYDVAREWVLVVVFRRDLIEAETHEALLTRNLAKAHLTLSNRVAETAFDHLAGGSMPKSRIVSRLESL